MKFFRTVTLIALTIGATPTSSAETSQDVARLGKALYIAFRCSALAGAMGEREEARRLFEMGYGDGTRFLKAVQGGIVSEADIRSTVPIAVTMRIEGPSIDFMLGRIYAAAEEDALDDVICGETECYDDQLQRSIAGGKYERENCELFGR